ncbi:hypothetical protein B566_EDAN008459 [Ephemera danica]|nr:hypothetical protein B566_EDAN008459 [Ephemera danica]
MAVPSDLSFESVRIFMLERGGKVTNHELVKFFKPALTRADTKVEARNQFKEFVNVLANIKNEDGEKYLILKARFFNPEPPGGYASHFGSSSPSPSLSSPCPSVSGSMLSISQESLLESPSRAPPPYRPPPPPTSSPRYNSPQQGPPPSYVSPPPPLAPMLRHVEGQEMEPPPPVPPRRRSSDKGKENMLDPNKRPKTEGEEACVVKKDVHADSSEPKISVKERTQKFNRLASESDLKPLPQLASLGKKKVDKLDAKAREWLVRAAQSDYQVMAKIVAERPKLARLRDPYVVSE